MARVLKVLLTVAVGVTMVLSYPDGGPLEACNTLIPNHNNGVNGMVGTPYSIASECYVILPNEIMRMRVWDRGGAGEYRGLFIQVRDGSGKISGTWSVTNQSGVNNPFDFFKTINCDGKIATTVTHKNNKPKKDSDFGVTWTAPATCADNEEFEIRATIVKTYKEWQTVTVPMLCKADYSNVAAMERVRPPLPVQYCAQGSWAIIPKGATTSFEKGPQRGGWRHFYGSPDLRFTRTDKPTPTANTGPMKAQDGKYYLYYEASGKRKHDMAGLLSPFGIQGCFCFSFWCHMNTDGQTKFTLSTIGDIQRLILQTTEVTNYWRQVSYSFLSDMPVLFAFQVFSSGSEKGDIGLDNIKVTAGPCDAAADGYAGYISLLREGSG